MADGIPLNIGIGGPVVDTEAIGLAGAHLQRVKLVIGARDTDGGDISAANPMPVLTSGAVGATSTPLTATIADTAAHVLGPFTPQLSRQMWMTLNATVAASGTAQLLRSNDGGTTKVGLTHGGALAASYLFGQSAPVTGVIANEPLANFETDTTATYWLAITLTSGTVTVRLAQ